jgi:hypothetical protein
MAVRNLYLVITGILCLWSLMGCKDARSYLGEIAAEVNSGVAAAPTAGSAGLPPRAIAAQRIAADIRAKRYIAGDAVEYGQKLIEAAAVDVAGSIAATTFAGGVLDAMVLLEDDLPQAGEFELFWIGVGRLAFRAAEESHARGRLPEAMTLTLAGPQRWQNQAYWERYSDHDGLTSLLLASTGQKARAIERLRDRADLRGPALDVFRALRGE